MGTRGAGARGGNSGAGAGAKSEGGELLNKRELVGGERRAPTGGDWMGGLPYKRVPPPL